MSSEAKHTLRACPFCGATPTVKTIEHLSSVYCPRHDCSGGPCAQAYFEEAAVRAWNNRPIEGALRVTIDALTAELADLRDELAALKADGEWVTVEDGQYRGNGNVWQVWDGMVGVKSADSSGRIYAGKLPSNWRLQRREKGAGDE